MEEIMAVLTLAIGWTFTVFIGLLGLTILYYIITGKINLENIISEPNGHASLSRFQFLVFTFVISMSFFLIVAAQSSFPDVPAGVFALLGISGGSYVVSKGIQTNRDIQLEKEKKKKSDKQQSETAKQRAEE